jgi:hypothetical protein
MRKAPKCKPSVYLNAAKLIASDEEVYSCCAIEEVVFTRGDTKYSDMDWYRIQYTAMFGPYINPEIQLSEKYGKELPTIPKHHFDKKINKSHPFWNKFYSKERKEQRILALLFMYEICRNP